MKDITDEISRASVIPPNLWKIEDMIKDGGGYKNKHKIAEHRGKKRLKIKSEYRKKAKRYLIGLIDLYTRKELVQEDLDDVYDTMGGIDYSKDRVSSSSVGSSTEGRIASREQDIKEFKNEIKALDKKIARFEKMKKNLTPIQSQVIEYKYLKKKENNISYSWMDIHKKTNYSVPRLKQIHKETLDRIAYILYGERATDK